VLRAGSPCSTTEELAARQKKSTGASRADDRPVAYIECLVQVFIYLLSGTYRLNVTTDTIRYPLRLSAVYVADVMR
jgi:hypothetical protein